MIDKPSPKKRTSKAPANASEENERPTVNPPFDVEAFARAATSPTLGTDLHTTHPPPPLFDPEPRSQAPTLTNEHELEAARAKSAQPVEPGPGRPPSGLLALANLRSPSALPPSGSSSTSPPAGAATPSSIEAAVLGAIRSSAPAPEITQRTIEDPVAEMRERASLGDYTGALEMAELVLAADPGNLDAAECAENCRSVLEHMYAARLGPSDGVPVVAVPQAQMQWLSIDHRAGFVLSLIDGSSTLEMVIDVSGMQKLDALRILHALVQQRIVAFKT